MRALAAATLLGAALAFEEFADFESTQWLAAAGNSSAEFESFVLCPGDTVATGLDAVPGPCVTPTPAGALCDVRLSCAGGEFSSSWSNSLAADREPEALACPDGAALVGLSVTTGAWGFVSGVRGVCAASAAEAADSHSYTAASPSSASSEDWEDRVGDGGVFELDARFAGGGIGSLAAGVAAVFDRPTLAALEAPVQNPVTGGALLTLTGTGFGDSVDDVAVTVGDTAACDVQSVSAGGTALTCAAPAGSGADVAVALAYKGVAAAETLAYTYDSLLLAASPAEAGVTATAADSTTVTADHVYADHAFSCLFESDDYATQTSAGAAESGTQVTCSLFAWDDAPAVDMYIYLRDDNTGATFGPVAFSFVEVVTGVSSMEASADGGESLEVYGFGFDVDAAYTCVFRGSSDSVSVVATVSSMELMTCVTEAWYDMEDTSVALRVERNAEALMDGTFDGFVFSGSVVAFSSTLYHGFLGLGDVAVSIVFATTTGAVATVSYATSLPDVEGEVFFNESSTQTIMIDTADALALAGGSGNDTVLVYLSLMDPPAGVSLGHPSAAVLTLCPLGSSVVDSAADACQPCVPGWHNNGSSLSCTACGVGSYASSYSSVECASCPAHSASPSPGAASVDACVCRQGYYRDEAHACHECDALLSTCMEPTTDGDLLEPGWYLGDGPITVELNRPKQCFNAEACLGGYYDPVTGVWGECLQGHTGFLCASCEPNHYRLNNECRVCPSYPIWLIVLIPSAALCLLFALLVARTSPLALRFSKLAMAINMLQIIALTGTLQARWPDTIQTVLTTLSLWNLNLVELFSVDCIAPLSYISRTALTLGAPTAVLLMLAAAVLLDRGYTALRVRRAGAEGTFLKRFDDEGFSLELRCKRGGVILLFVSYVLLTSQILGCFNCVDVDGDLMLVADMRVDCRSTEYYYLLGLAVAGLVLYAAGVWALFAWLLYRARGRLEQPDTVFVTGPLYTVYRPEMFFWELVLMAKRVALVSAHSLVSNGENADVQLLLFCWIILAYSSLVLYKRPFSQVSTFWFALLSNLVQFVVAFGGIIFFYTDGTESANRDLMTVVVLITLVAVVLFVGLGLIVEGVRRWRELRTHLALRRQAAESRRPSLVELANMARPSGAEPPDDEALEEDSWVTASPSPTKVARPSPATGTVSPPGTVSPMRQPDL